MFVELCIFFALACIAFFVFLWKNTSYNNLGSFLIIGLIARLAVSAQFPNLSDDVYRFYWDGLLACEGINPFDYTPTAVLETFHSTSIIAELESTYPLLNSPDYHSVYPTICQGLFATAAWISNDIESFALCLRLFLIIGELFLITSCYFLLNRLQIDRQNLWLYVLNPLVILEVTLNLHFEGLMMAFAIMSISFIIAYRKNPKAVYLIASMVFMAAAIQTKLLPLLLMPLIFFWLRWKPGVIYATGLCSLLCISSLPFINTALDDNVGESLNLYFQNFEFNASLYFLLNRFLHSAVDYETSLLTGRILGLACLVFIVALSWIKRDSSDRSLLLICLILWCAYLIQTSTLHPWYLVPVIVFSIFTRYRFPVVWSGLIYLTYITYTDPDNYAQNYWLVLLEYLLLVAYTTYEILKGRNQKVLV